MSKASTKTHTPKAKKALKRSVEWWTWEEYSRHGEGAAEALADYRAAGWRPAGRMSMTIFVDGSAQIAIPMRKDTVSVTRLFDFSAKDLKGRAR